MQRSRRNFLRQLGSTAICLSASPNRILAAGADVSAHQVLYARLAADPLRPQFHLLPAKNWMNDPNGPIYWKGWHHMFFQYNPHAAVWGDMHWAHAISRDMIHWRHLPIALMPTASGDDADGCFTGSAVDDRGTATIIYTGVKTAPPERATLRDGVHNFREVQCLATSTDAKLRTWTKSKQPILEPPKDPRLTGFRDPFLWREADAWYLGVGAGWRNEGGCVLLYRSRDLRQWEYLHPLASGKWTEKRSVNPVDSGEMWECPDFFALGSKHVLLYATAGKVTWEIGELDRKEMLFHAEKRGELDHGAYIAQKTQLDAHGNRILWGWIPEKRPEAEFSAAGWAGCMALPRVLSLGADGGLEMRFAREADSLRSDAASAPPRVSPFPGGLVLGDGTIENLCGEFFWKSASRPYELILADNKGAWWAMEMEADRWHARVKVNKSAVELSAPSFSEEEFEREFHLYLDASVAELICDNKHAITTRIYRKPDGPLGMVTQSSGPNPVRSFKAWRLRAISNDRLTS